MDPRQRLVNQWNDLFQTARDFDKWGQVIEAADEYEMLAKKINRECNSESCCFTKDQSEILEKIATCLQSRGAGLQSTNIQQIELTYDDVAKVQQTLRQLLQQRSPQTDFPVEITPAMKIKAVTVHDIDTGDLEDVSDEDGDEDEHGGMAGRKFSDVEMISSHPLHGGKLFPRIPPEKDTRLLTIHIEKVGIKEAPRIVDPYITILLKDATGVDITPFQDTPVSLQKLNQYIHFDVNVELQRPLERLPRGSAIFFELKHYKPKKKMISTKCFAFLELDEIKDGSAVIELYRKPADYRRRRLNLLTTKKLYLHLHMTLHQF